MRDRKDIDGNPVTLDKLCRLEPAWAASRIRVMEAELARLRELRDALLAWCASSRHAHVRDTREEQRLDRAIAAEHAASSGRGAHCNRCGADYDAAGSCVRRHDGCQGGRGDGPSCSRVHGGPCRAARKPPGDGEGT